MNTPYTAAQPSVVQKTSVSTPDASEALSSLHSVYTYTRYSQLVC